MTRTASSAISIALLALVLLARYKRAVLHVVTYDADADAERQWVAAFIVSAKVAGMSLGSDADGNMTYGVVELHPVPRKSTSLPNTPKPGLRAWAYLLVSTSSLVLAIRLFSVPHLLSCFLSHICMLALAATCSIPFISPPKLSLRRSCNVLLSL